MDFEQANSFIKTEDFFSYIGKVKNVSGTLVESTGSHYAVGDVCRIMTDKPGREVEAEVIGFNKGQALLMPYGDLNGVCIDNKVLSTKSKMRVPVGDFLKGRIIDATGKPIDGGEMFDARESWYVDSEHVNPLMRPRINETLSFGIKAIDGMLTIGKGQRMGIFAGSGVGKSTLMGMIARNGKADINVIALVGERGREVREFIDKDLGEEGLRRSVLVVATSDQSAMMRCKCAKVATTVAEYFMNKGADVLLMMDSLTRFAMAQREIGLSAGEPPVARGYTPSIYVELPKLLERSGKFKKGSITGIYTVLVEGDDTNEPISDTVRGIVDGHIVLSRTFANRNHFPAIDVNMSISRLMNDIAAPEHKKQAKKIRDILSTYYANYDLISIGAYKKGTNPDIDRAIEKISKVNEFLQQDVGDKITFEETLSIMSQI